MALLKNLRSSYIPINIFRINPKDQGVQVLDDLNATYNTLREEVQTFENFTITDAEAGLPDLIASLYFGDESLWWVICLYNSIIDPISELTTGKRIRIPNIQSTTLFLNRKLNPNIQNQRKNTFTSI